MKDKFFIDTNIFINSFNSDDPEKRHKANEIIKSALLEHRGCISTQVIQEFMNVATQKFSAPMSTADCEKYFKSVLAPICKVFTSMDLYSKALDIMDWWKLSFYDSLIITAALQADCTILYSEDLQHNQKIQSLTIINPFL